ncbi:hypothetical protein BJ165DRAFT_323828 [Panaeolus papilionaceus]|nr:hypothetical protein BJ165DRAFT_323828 [Panaeolus papilionaceus]
MPASAWMLRPWIPVMMLLAVRLRSPDRSHWTLVTAIQLAMHEGHMHAKSPIFPVTYPQPETLTKLSGTTWHHRNAMAYSFKKGLIGVHTDLHAATLWQ